jgi:hypothetical protein
MEKINSNSTAAEVSCASVSIPAPSGSSDSPPIKIQDSKFENPASSSSACRAETAGEGGPAVPKSDEGKSSGSDSASQLGVPASADSEIKIRKSKIENREKKVVPPGAQLLHEVCARFEYYLVLPPGAAVALTLWTAHTHCFTAFRLTPRLNLQSPEPGCGKTTTLDVIASLVPRPVRTENLTAPILFRLVDQSQPTLLLDEVDAYLPQAEELRGLLNAGHKRGACAYRCVGGGGGKSKALQSFKAFAPAVLSGLGKLPGTLHDRSIHIPLIQAEPGQIKAWFDESQAETEASLNQQLARWTSDNFNAIRDLAASPRETTPVCLTGAGHNGSSPDPGPIENQKSKTENLTLRMPSTAHNRLGDNWRPLFAIAEIAGGDWPQLVIQSFNQLTCSGGSSTINSQPPTLKSTDALLASIRELFTQSGQQRIHCRDLVAALRSKHGNKVQITQKRLSRHLAKLGVRSRNLRTRTGQAKGYELTDFSEPSGNR